MYKKFLIPYGIPCINCLSKWVFVRTSFPNTVSQGLIRHLHFIKLDILQSLLGSQHNVVLISCWPKHSHITISPCKKDWEM